MHQHKIYTSITVIFVISVILIIIISFASTQSVPIISPPEVKLKLDSNKNSIIIDVRSQEGYTGELGHIPGALLRPLPEINQWMEEFKDQKNPEFIMVCRSGNRSARATKLLREHGISNVKNMRGGMLEWNRIKLPIENTIGDDKGVKDKKN